MRRRRASSSDVRKIAMDVVWAEVYFPDVVSRVETVAAGSGPCSEGLGRLVAMVFAGVRWLRFLSPWTPRPASIRSPGLKSAFVPWR